jgi:tellurite resistance protein TerC
MVAVIQIQPWHWAGFILGILALLALDLGVFQRAEKSPAFRASLAWSVVWFLLAMGFAGVLALWLGAETGLQFVAGYMVEYSLSLDNVLAISLILAWFQVPPGQQHRVLYWGIVGALVMRGLMIGAGAALLRSFHWLFYVMGAFLLWTGLRWGFSRESVVQPENNRLIRLARKFFPVTPGFEGKKFFGVVAGRRALTPLALALVMIETTDLIFATDSIPAIFAVTQDAFVVFTSNICAVLGLRSLYFLLAGAMENFRFLKTGLSLVLAFVGVKMLVSHWWAVSTGVTLAVVAVVLGAAILLSVARPSARTHSEPSR